MVHCYVNLKRKLKRFIYGLAVTLFSAFIAIKVILAAANMETNLRYC